MKTISSKPVAKPGQDTAKETPEMARFLEYGKIYTESQPDPPAQPGIDPATGLPMQQTTPGAKANKTMQTRKSTLGPSAHTEAAMQKKTNQGNQP